MALHKRLVLAGLSAISLLCIYILCVSLERPSARALGPQGPQVRFQGPQGPQVRFQRLPEGGSSASTDAAVPPQLTDGATEQLAPSEKPPAAAATALHNPVRTDVPATQPSGSRSDPAGGTRTKATEPSFIGDSYASEEAAPLTNCSDSIRRHVGSTSFAAAFLERLPVLQSAEHADQDQYRRLRRYPGAHGWAGIDYHTLLDSLSVLNGTANRQMLDDWTARRSNASECSRCAVVGNGGILKDSKKGREIDGHHYVFRTNGAVIKGFEQDVGTRTTHYTFSTNTLMNSMRSYAAAGYKGPPVSEETRYVFLPDHDRDYLLMKAAATHTVVPSGPDKGKRPWLYFGDQVSASSLKMYHPDFMRYLRNRFLRSRALDTKYKNIYRPSTGATMLLAALHTCDQVSAYGFMTPDYSSYSDHYYDSSFHPVGFFINHDLRLELQLWQQLHRQRLITLYMRQ